jgi:hypothetical protein
MEAVTHIVNLAGGYVQGDVAQTRVVFGHRITASDLFRLDQNPQAVNPTQYNDLVISTSIVEFGSLQIPVPLRVLLSLDSVDREDLVEGHNIFSALSAEGHGAEFLSDNGVKLGWGFKVNDVIYNRVQFGKRITGMDEVDADRAGLTAGLRRSCFLIGRQISKICAADGTAEIQGPLPLEYFDSESLDGADVVTLRGAAELWRQSFRVAGAHLSRNGRGAQRADNGDKNRVERGANTGDAARTV